MKQHLVIDLRLRLKLRDIVDIIPGKILQYRLFWDLIINLILRLHLLRIVFNRIIPEFLHLVSLLVCYQQVILRFSVNSFAIFILFLIRNICDLLIEFPV